MDPTSESLLQRLGRVVAAGAAAARIWRALLILLLVVVSYLALTPKPPESIDLGWDKLNHVLSFTALAFSAYMAYPVSRGTRLLLLCVLLAFGGLIEVLQMFVPGRSPAWGDLVGDSFGIACGAVIAVTMRSR